MKNFQKILEVANEVAILLVVVTVVINDLVGKDFEDIGERTEAIDEAFDEKLEELEKFQI